MIDLIALSSVPALLAMFLQEKRSRKEAVTAQTIDEFQEWLRRQRHDEVVAALASQESILRDLGLKLEDIADRSEIEALIRQSIVNTVRGLRGFGWLSKTMPTSRVDSTLPLIGRDQELAVLESRADEDTVIVGQPGSGKTFLLEQFAANSDAEFVLPKGGGVLREELRLARPSTVIVDDCGDKRDIVSELIDLRERDSEARYRIIAVCWPSETDIVAQWLRRSSTSVLEMQPLPRDTMVEVVKAAGIHGPNSIIRMIVDQSMNKPGLAVTLSKIALDQGVPDVWRGSALYAAVRDWFEHRIGKQATGVLAAFAIGGQHGINREVVEDWSGLSPVELGDMLKELATGGILHETDNRNMSVQPEALRHALLKEHFFAGAASADPSDLMAAVPDRKSIVKSLIGVARIDGTVDDAQIRELLLEVGSNNYGFSDPTDPWLDYAYLGEDEAQYVLDKFPHYLMLDSTPFLHHISATVIPMLIGRAAEVNDWRERIDRSALHELRHWIEQAPPEGGEAVKRRHLLASAAVKWVRRNEPNDAGIATLALAFTPEFQCGETDPGVGRTFTIRSGCLGVDAIKELGLLWDRVAVHLRDTHVTHWKPLMDMISEWAHPGRYLRGKTQSRKEREALTVIADSITVVCARMVADVARLSGKHPGVHHLLAQHRARIVGTTTCHTDETFELLYYDAGYNDGYEERLAANADRVRELAKQWAHDGPSKTADRINQLQQYADQAGILSHTNWHWVLSDALAREAAELPLWVDPLLSIPCSAHSLGPFLSEAIRRNTPDAEDLISRVMAHPRGCCAGIEAALVIPDPSPTLLAELESTLAEKPGLEFGFRMRDTPTRTVRWLLESATSHVAGWAAIGEWYCGSEHEIREELREAWESAVVRGIEDDHVISRICEQFPLVGFEWIRKRLGVAGFYWFRFNELLGVASRVFSKDQRLELLKEASDRHSEVIHAFVRLDASIYKSFLCARDADHPNLAPLERHDLSRFQMDDEAWVQVARVALDHGADPNEIVARCLYPHGAYHDGPDLWWERIKWYEELSRKDDTRLRDVGLIGIELAKARRDAAIREKRNEDLRGL